VKLSQFVASLYPYMPTNFSRLILIFNKMALIFLGVLIIFTVSRFELQQVRLLRLHRYWWVAPIHPTSIHWIDVWGQCWSLNTSCNKSPKQFPSLKMHLS